MFKNGGDCGRMKVITDKDGLEKIITQSHCIKIRRPQMKHILSTITIFFILLTSSVSWSENVGYGDLRIGSDKSIIDEHCIKKIDQSIPFFVCYDLDENDFSFRFNDDNKITSI